MAVRVHHVIFAVGLQRAHELVGDSHRNVEVGHRAVTLAVDELQDVGVINPQYSHVGAATGVVADEAIGDIRMVLFD